MYRDPLVVMETLETLVVMDPLDLQELEENLESR